MKITVILCTYNRCGVLAKALDSVAASRLPASTNWEVLVIDNNSSDGTRDVIEGYCRNFPDRFRYIFESKQGKSHALNNGIRQARGELLAFIDDDVIAEPLWLQNLTEPLINGNWGGAGGRILAQEIFAVPRWLPMEGPYSLSGMLALFDLGDHARELTCPPFGTNMAFRKSIFEKYGMFRTDMGPCPGSEIRNEDTEFGRRLMSAGVRLWYEPSAVVYHAVPESRLTKSYLLRFWYDQGRASIREITRRPDIAGIPRHYFTIVKTMAVLAPVRALKWLTALDSRRRFYWQGWVWKTAGEIVELHRQRRAIAPSVDKSE